MVEGHTLEDVLFDYWSNTHRPLCECGWDGAKERTKSAALDAWHIHAAAQEPMTFQQLREKAWEMRRADAS